MQIRKINVSAKFVPGGDSSASRNKSRNTWYK